MDDLEGRPVKRSSPSHKTPKECKEERRKILRMSIQKLRHMEDCGYFLTRSVLINNTLKKLQKEICEEIQFRDCIYGYDYDVLNKSFVAPPDSDFEDLFFPSDDSDKMITDPLTEMLVNGGGKDQTDSPRADPIKGVSDCALLESNSLCVDHETLGDVDTMSASNSFGEWHMVSDIFSDIFTDMDFLNNMIHALDET